MLESNGGLSPDPPDNEPQDMEVEDEEAKAVSAEKTDGFTVVGRKSPSKAVRAKAKLARAAAAAAAVEEKDRAAYNKTVKARSKAYELVQS